MKRRRGSGKFGGRESDGGEINPLDGVANLADVMLVFACGLMLALITYWNVDVSGAAESVSEPVSGVEITEDVARAGESAEVPDQEGLEEYGVVYRDPATGKLYILAEDGNS